MAKTKELRPTKDALELFGPSIKAITVNLWSFVGLGLLPAMFITIMTAIGMLNNIPSDQTGGAEGVAITGSFVLLLTAGILLSLLIAPALVYLQLQSVKGNKIGIIDALSTGFTYLWRYIGLSIVVGVMLFLGLLLLIVPGLIVLRRYYLAPFFLIDKNVGIQEAMDLSAAASKPYSWAVWSIILVTLAFSLLGFFPTLGAFAGMILQLLYSCAPALRYEEIKHAAKN